MSLIVIEGLDGSGKATHAEILAERKRKAGETVRKITFPNYESESSALIKTYLSGALGGLNQVNVYAVSSFYASDRYISYQTDWKKDYLMGHTIIADRYATSNVVHQMSRLPRVEWEEYLDWLYDYEFVRIGIPKPDKVIYLDLPPEFSQKLMLKRYGGDDSMQDIHEADLGYQETCRESALFAAERLGWNIIACCAEQGGLLTIEEIADRIWEAAN